nr:hypothetical protein [Nostoc sp. DedQUE02]
MRKSELNLALQVGSDRLSFKICMSDRLFCVKLIYTRVFELH